MSDVELRSLDAWIAEHVMGYEERQSYRGSSVIKGETFWVVAGRAATSPAFKGQHRFPEFSTEPAAAMQVLEKCGDGQLSRGGETDMCIRKSVSGWIIDEITTGEDYGMLKTATAATLPLAICLFAKKLFTAA